MGFLGDLFDDVISIPAKLVEAPIRIVHGVGCAVSEHDWGPWKKTRDGWVRKCCDCGLTERR